MQTLEQALDVLLGTVRAPQGDGWHERMPTGDALGRVLAQDLGSPLDVPPADNSAMDGYAVRCADVPAVGTVLSVSQRLAAGQVGVPLAPGTAARIFTGAPVPPGADAVLMQEHCEALDGAVRLQALPRPGLAIRRRGEDVAAGAVVLPQGTRLSPQALGLAATVGAATLAVARRPRVALLSTGNELVAPGQPLRPGTIYDANRTTLRALVQALGGQCSDLGTVPDDLHATRAVLRQAAQDHDLVLTSGGVSVGEEDHLKAALRAEGRLHDWKLAIKPGKPLAFGELPGGPPPGAAGGIGPHAAYVLGLPGNPVSSFITFLLLVRPVLLRLQGADPSPPRGLPIRADFEHLRADPARREFLRVRRNASGGLDLFPNQGSGVLSSVVWADGLVDNPPGQAIRRGDTVCFLPLQSFWA